MLGVKTFVNAVPAVYEALSSARSDLLTRIREVCQPENVQPVAHLIAAIINEDTFAMKSTLDMRHQRTYAVKVLDHIRLCSVHLLMRF